MSTFFNKVWGKLINSYPSFALPLSFAFALPLKKDKPHLIHSHFGPSAYNFLTLKGIFKLPLVTTFYGYDMSLLPHCDNKWKTRYKKLFFHGDHFLVEGSYMKKCLMKLGCPEKKITIQHIGIDLNRIKFVPRRLGKNGVIRILIAGSFREKKGISYAIEAFGRVRKKYKNLWLTIIGDSAGTPREEEEKKKILASIKKYRLNNCVEMMGYQPSSIFLEELYNHHIFLSPSIHASDGDIEGGAPVSIIEASASGMPVLSTTHCDIPEVIINGEGGYLVPEKDINALSEKLDFLISHPDMWEEMGRKGRIHIKKNYNVTTQVQKLEGIYDVVVERYKYQNKSI